MRFSLAHLRLVPVLFAIIPAITACGSTSVPPRYTLRIPVYGRAVIPDPAQAESPQSIFLASLMFSGLVKFSPDMHVIPELAVSIPTISSNGTIYTFTVRRDARFADGRQCTAADVSASFARALSPGTQSSLARRYLGNIVGAAAVENGSATSLSGVTTRHRLTLRIRLRRADADFLQKLAFPVAAVVDTQRWQQPVASQPTLHAGTGPWEVASRTPDGTLVLRPRHHFYGGSLGLHTLMLLPVRNEIVATDLYRRRALDVAELPMVGRTAYAGRSDVHSSPSLDAYYAVPPAADPQIASHLDRDGLVSSLPGMAPLSDIIPPAIPDYVSPSASVGDGSTSPTLDPGGIRLVSQESNQTIDRLEALMYDQWPRARSGGVRITIIHAVHLLPVPSVWLAMVLPYTRSHWYHHLLRRAKSLTNDPVTRMSLYSDGEAWALSKGLIIPLTSGTEAYLIRSAVQNLEVTPLGLMPANNNWTSVSVS